MTNEQVVKRFLDHKSGNGGSLNSCGDRLRSYNAEVAAWAHDLNGHEFLALSNRTATLGGGSYSQTTSTHIGLAYRMALAAGYTIQLYDGWITSGKTTGDLIKA